MTCSTRRPSPVLLRYVVAFAAAAMLIPASLANARTAVGKGHPVGGTSKVTAEQTSGTHTDSQETATTNTVAAISPAKAVRHRKEEVVTPAPAFSIAVQGNHLVNGAGKTITLHGVNISGTEWECLYGKAFAGPSDAASIAAMVAWHVNAVRIPLNEDCWLGINGAPTNITAYHEAIRGYVERLHAQGLYAILDLHWAAPGTTIAHWGTGPGETGHYDMPDADHSPAFWTSLASYFKADHAVLFDLFNEPRIEMPSPASWACWRDGCTVTAGGASPVPVEYQAAGMQSLVNAVRATGSTSPVMVGGLWAASQVGTRWVEYAPKDPAGQLVASEHNYEQSESEYSNSILPAATKVPVVVGEVGEQDCAHGYIDKFLPWADSHGVSYTAWAWYGWGAGCASYPTLISNYDGTPTNYGIGYRNHLVSAFPAPSSTEVATTSSVGSRLFARSGARRLGRVCVPAGSARAGTHRRVCRRISAKRVATGGSRRSV
jgi:endoglucanase